MSQEVTAWPMFRLNLQHTAVREGAAGLSDESRLCWKFNTGDTVESSPAVVDGVLYFGAHDGHIYAIESAAGF